MSRVRTIAAAAALCALAACGEKPQGAGGAASDAAPFTGTGNAYAVQGWKQGDKTSWEQQLRARAQGQNDYARAN
jgi:hypothetical protein